MKKILLFLVTALGALSSTAEEMPKLELGVGFAAQHLRDYRGSNESQTQSLPFPFLIYRGERLRADRDGIRGNLFRSHLVELNVSGEAALNGGSKDNKKRQGMPELDTAVEFGPSLNFNLSGRNFNEGWSLRFPVRAVFTVSFEDIKHIGFNFNPKFTYRQPHLFDGWEGKVDLGLLWASRDYHKYYYDVAERYVTESRPFYEAQQGYSGTYLKFGLKKRSGRFWYGWNLRYDNISGTVFEDSPLVETEHYFSTAVAIGWFFWASDEKAD